MRLRPPPNRHASPLPRLARLARAHRLAARQRLRRDGRFSSLKACLTWHLNSPLALDGSANLCFGR